MNRNVTEERKHTNKFGVVSVRVSSLCNGRRLDFVALLEMVLEAIDILVRRCLEGHPHPLLEDDTPIAPEEFNKHYNLDFVVRSLVPK